MTCTETRDEEELYPKTAAGKVHVAPEATIHLPDSDILGSSKEKGGCENVWSIIRRHDRCTV